jgi:predicted alpha/beta hydrolase
VTAELKILSADGALHSAPLFFPQGTGPVVLCLPAMGAAADYYRPFADALARAGMLAALLDLRGQGRSSVRARRGDDFGYREILELDLPTASAELRRAFPGRRLYIAGHSLGGQLALFFAARHSHLVDGLVLVAAGTAFCSDWPSAFERAVFRLMTAGIRAAAHVLPWYPGSRLGFGGDQPKRLMRDWGRVTSEGIYRPEGADFDYEAAARRFSLPVLSIGIREDPVAPASARDALLRRAPLARLSRVEVDGVRHHRRWKRHFSWARSPEEIVLEMRKWLDAEASGADPEFAVGVRQVSDTRL